MIQLFEKGAYVFNGNQVVAEEAIGAEYKKYMEQLPNAEECKKNSLGYQILAAHNTSGNMEKLKIKFGDKMLRRGLPWFKGVRTPTGSNGVNRLINSSMLYT